MSLGDRSSSRFSVSSSLYSSEHSLATPHEFEFTNSEKFSSSRNDLVQRSNAAPIRWRDHPIYGLVHDKPCAVCSAYISHRIGSQVDPSVQDVLKMRDHERDITFADGIIEGRKKQREEDMYIFEEIQRLRLQAHNEESRFQAEYQRVQEILFRTQSELNTSQAECENLRFILKGFMNNTPVSRASQAEAAHLRFPWVANREPTQDTGMLDNINRALSSSGQRSETRPIINAAPTYATVVASSPSSASPYRHVDILPIKSPVSFSSPPTRALGTVTANTASPGPGFLNPTTVPQLQALMDAAHKPGNVTALTRIKSLCAVAHATPRGRKSEVQRYLLANWRNPIEENIDSNTPLGHQSTTVSRPNPRMEDPPEVWFEYYCAHQGSWPRGVRRDLQNRPVMSDLKASRTIARLRPELERVSGTLTSRAEFMSVATEIFHIPGMYRRLLRLNGLRVGSEISFKPYYNLKGVVSADDVVRHFAECGITAQAATEEFEPWAQSYRGVSLESYASSESVTTSISQTVGTRDMEEGSSSRIGLPQRVNPRAGPKSLSGFQPHAPFY